MLAKMLPIVLMGIAPNKWTVIMCCLSAKKRDHTPTDNLTSYPEANVGDINEATISGFKGPHLNETHALCFSSQCLHEWVTHISHNTGMDLGEHIELPKLLTNHNGQVYWGILVLNEPPLLLPF